MLTQLPFRIDKFYPNIDTKTGEKNYVLQQDAGLIRCTKGVTISLLANL